MENEKNIIKNETSNIQEVLFRKKIAEEALPYLTESLGAEEAKKLSDRLIEEFKNTEGWGDFENRVEVTIHNITHSLAIQSKSKRKKISDILNLIISERLTDTIKNIRNSESIDGPNKIIPFKRK